MLSVVKTGGLEVHGNIGPGLLNLVAAQGAVLPGMLLSPVEQYAPTKCVYAVPKGILIRVLLIK